MSKSKATGLVINAETIPVIEQFADNIPGGFFIYHADENEEIIYANKHMAEIFGCESDEEFREHVHNSFRGVVHPDDYEVCHKEITMQTGFKNGSTDQVRYRFTKKDGTVGILDDYGYLTTSKEYGDIFCVFVSEDTKKDNLQTIVSTLVEDYEVLFHIDFVTGRNDFYKIGPWIDPESQDAFAEMDYIRKINYFANKYVYAEDRDYFLKCVQKETAMEIVGKNVPLVIRFRMEYKNQLQWYGLKGVHHAEHVGKQCAIIGIRNVNNEMAQQEALMKASDREHQHLLAFHDIIHSGMWNIVLDKDSNIISVKWSDEYRRLLGYNDEEDFPNTLNSWCDKLHPDDREMALEKFWAGAKNFGSEIVFDTDFRLLNKNGKYRWYHAAGRMEPNDDGTYLYFGIFVENTAEHENAEYQEIQKQNLDIIQILASEYSSVYYIDLSTDGLTPYSMNAETESEFGQIFNSGISYSEAFRLYVDKLILSDDKEMMLQEGSVENIRKKLANQKTYITSYRSSDNRYNEMKFVKVNDENDEPTAVALGFADRDDEIRARMKEEQERQRNFDIIEILASEYSSVYYIDLSTDGLTPYSMNAETESEFGQIFNSGISYSEAFKLYVDKLILSDDKNMMLQEGSVENIRKKLANQKTYITSYRSSDNRYNEMKFVKVNDENDEPTAVALGFADRDDEIRARIREEEERQRNFDIIEILASEYSSVYYIDLSTDGLTPYSMNAETESEFGQIFNSGISYSEAFRLYVDKLILSDDKNMMLQEGSVENIRRMLANQKTYITSYRSSDNRYNEMKFVKVNDENDEPTAVALGFADRDDEIRARMKEEQERQRNFDIIEILASEYSSVYYIDLATDGLTPYSMNAETESEFGQIFNSGISYSEAFRLYVDKLILSDDKNMMLQEGSVENIRRMLANQKTYITSYRSSDNRYNEMKFVKVNDENDEPTAVALGFADKDAEIRARQEEERKRQRNNEIIEILASEYSSVYYIDLATDELDPYTMNAETESEFGQIFNSGISYSKAFKMYVDKLILSADKKMMLDAGSTKSIIENLRNKKTYITQYRSSDNRYNEMKFVKVDDENDEPTAVALGFADKDELIRDEKQRALEETRYYAVIKALSSEYSSIYYADIENDILMPYSNSKRIKDKFGEEAFYQASYTQGVRAYAEKACSANDRELLEETLSVKHVKSQLESKPYFTLIYQNDKNEYCEMKCVRANEEGDVTSIVVGFAVKDTEIRESLSREEEKQRNFDIIEILASEYSSVYYIDLRTDELDPYTMNEDTESTFGQIFRSGIRYSDAYRMYVEQLIHSEDKAMMLKAGSIGNIMKELRNKKTFLTTYRNSEGHYSEMKFVKVGNEDNFPTAVALGFADKDEELRAREEEQQKLQRNIDIIEILASEYTSVYYIDLTTDELDPYTMNEETETEFGQIFRSGIKYSDAFKMYVKTLVHEDDKEMMLTAGSIYNILKELGNKKTFITTYRNAEGHYSEMKFVKVGEEENPQSVALGFADRDEEVRAEMQRKQIADRDMAVITGLSDDFGCVVYVDFNEYDEVHYRFDSTFEKYIPGWADIDSFFDRLNVLTKTIMHPDDRDAFWTATRPELVHKMVDKDGVYFVNFRILVEGEIIYYQLKFARDENSKDHVIAGFHNVDAETKREMDALEKAESASKAKTDFLFNMSHDIRTPMNAIIGFTNMAIKEIDNKEKAVESLKKVRLSSDMLLSLINDILDMSRIESGKVVLNEQKAEMRKIFGNIDPVMTELARSKDIDLSFEYAEIRDNFVYCDIPRFERVLVNIVSNAIKYTLGGGKVHAKVSQVPGGKNGYELYRFEIADTGIGMSKEFQAKMFEEFAREETSTNSGIQGTGLGLALAQKLTILMNGTIECESEQGVGTTFYITIPLRLLTEEDKIEAEKAEEEIVVDLDGKRVLLVEDNELNREIATDILEDEGMIIETAVNGADAVKIMTEKGDDYYDFILMDIQMPILDGYGATKEIRNLIPSLKAPIIALSANAFEEDKKKSREAGMDDHIAKPINIAQLLGVLKKFIK